MIPNSNDGLLCLTHSIHDVGAYSSTCYIPGITAHVRNHTGRLQLIVKWSRAVFLYMKTISVNSLYTFTEHIHAVIFVT